MRPYLKISFCTVCRNRLAHIKETLIRNIQDNESYPAVEFNLLNYNSDDGMEEWVRQDMIPFIERKIFNYFKAPGPACFDHSHSRNMLFKLSTGDIFCNLDADNFAGENFAFYINEIMNREGPARVMVRSKELKSERERNTSGRVCMHRDSFFKINGYDERMKGHGFEDTDLIRRLVKSGVEPFVIENDRYLQSVLHSQTLRTKEHPMTKALVTVLISYINYYTSEVILLCKDNRFEQAVLMDAGLLYSLWQDRPAVIPDTSDNLDFALKDSRWVCGRWTEEDDMLELLADRPGTSGVLRKTQAERGQVCYYLGEKCFWPLDKGLFTEDVLYVYPQLKNRAYMQENEHSGYVVNGDGFGKGNVYVNFGDKLLTI